MNLFENIEQVKGAEILDEHLFPLFEITGLYQKFFVARENIKGECIIVNLNEDKSKSDEEILNLIVASGYVADDSDISFRIDVARQFIYAYFNLSQ